MKKYFVVLGVGCCLVDGNEVCVDEERVERFLGAVFMASLSWPSKVFPGDRLKVAASMAALEVVFKVEAASLTIKVAAAAFAGKPVGKISVISRVSAESAFDDNVTLGDEVKNWLGLPIDDKLSSSGCNHLSEFSFDSVVLRIELSSSWEFKSSAPWLMRYGGNKK